MKILAISTAILLTSSVSTYADNLSVSAKSDIAKAKPVIMFSHADIKSNGEHASLGGANGDFESMSHQMGFINAMKNTVSSSADYAFLLGLSQKNHAAYDALTRLIIIKELVKLNNRMASIQDLHSIKNSLKVISGQALYLPSVSFKAVLLHGVMIHADNSETLTMAVTSNIVDPTNHAYALKDCRIRADAYGDLSTLRVQIKPKEIVCQDAKTGEWLGSENISGYVAGSDGMQGLRARYKVNQQMTLVSHWSPGNKTYTNKVKILSPVLIVHAGMKAIVYLTKGIVLKPIDVTADSGEFTPDADIGQGLPSDSSLKQFIDRAASQDAVKGFGEALEQSGSINKVALGGSLKAAGATDDK